MNSTVKGLIYGLIYGLGFKLVAQLILLFKFSQVQWSLALVLTTMLTMGAIFGVAGGLKGLEIDTKTVFASLEARSVTIAEGSGATFGLLFGLLLGGGQACIRHFTLRLTLYRQGFMPWNYARFLNYACDIILLQKVGGCYIFVHRLLLEHFAQMELER